MVFNTNKMYKLLFGASFLTLSIGVNAIVKEAEPQLSTIQAQGTDVKLLKRIIVKYKESAVAASDLSVTSNVMQQTSAHAKKGMRHVRRIATGAHLMLLEQEVSNVELNEIITDMSTDPNIEYVEEDRLMKIMTVPSDPLYDDQWHYFESTGGLNLPNAWDISIGTGAIVAVIDTGYTAHEDLQANLLPGYDMISDSFVGNDGDARDSDASDPGDAAAAGECGTGSSASTSSWHGSHVAGTVAAAANNGIGGVGVAYGAKIVPVRALGKCGGYTSDIADAMIWAAGGSVSGVPTNPYPADVLNLSLGGSGSCDTTTQAAINSAVNLGASVVVAAGNSNENVSNSSPANCSNVITVAAVGRTGGRAYYSNYGTLVDIAAPGGDQSSGTSNGILSTLNAGSDSPDEDIYGYYQGTSMAAPHVAGAAALLYALDPSITPAQVEATLKNTSRSFPSTCSSCGSGIVDATAALESLINDPVPTEPETGLQNGVAQTNISGASGSETYFSIEIPAGATDLSFQISGGSGDADLYVRFGAEPTLSSYDCRPWANGNAESCPFASPSAGTYYVMIQGYSAYSGLSLVASFSEPSDGGGENDSISETGLAASTGTFQTYALDVPAGASALNVVLSGGSGDADLYVRFGSEPTTSTYDCRSWNSGNSDSCTINSPSAGTWYIGINSYASYSGLTLEASSE